MTCVNYSMNRYHSNSCAYTYTFTGFKHQNNYPSWFIDKVYKQVQQA